MTSSRQYITEMRQRSPHILRLALFTDRVSLVSRRVFEGMMRYASDHPNVRVAHWKTLSLADRRLIAEARLDGILFETLIDHDHSTLPRNVPAISVSSVLKKSPCPRVCDDQQWAGTIAARYFVGRGFRRFAYCGYEFHHGSKERQEGFLAELERAGFDCDAFEFGGSTLQEVSCNSRGEQQRVARWLKRLPPHCAVFSFCDEVALAVIQGCGACGRSIPEDIAVLGVDNDPFLQSALSLKLSSISLGTPQTGYKAAAALVRWIKNGKKPPPETRFRSARVMVRETTDHHHVDDELLTKSLELLRVNIRRPLSFSEIARRAGCSRRTLERRFRDKLGSTLGEVAQRNRLEHVQQWLGESDASLKTIADECGFSSSQHLCSVFRERMEITPVMWRKSQRASDL